MFDVLLQRRVRPTRPAEHARRRPPLEQGLSNPLLSQQKGTTAQIVGNVPNCDQGDPPRL